ncbi:MAG: 4-alpha-glucanotransferase [Acidimicrobiales bacterium]
MTGLAADSVADLPSDLAALATLYDVQTGYVDAAGDRRAASPDALRAVLAALGAPVTDVRGAWRAERLRQHVEPMEPVCALPSVGSQVVEIALPHRTHPRDCWLSVQDEEGKTSRHRLMPSIRRPLGTSTLEGVRMERYEARLGSPLEMLAPGYYRVRLEGPDVDTASLAVVAPRCPVPARGWCAFLPLHAMRTATDWGVGNYAALRTFSEWVSALGGDLVGTLPLYPLFLDGQGATRGDAPSLGGHAHGAGAPPSEPLEVSPYLPVTRLGWNELYVDPTALPELEGSADAQALLASERFRAELAAARRGELVDYLATMSLVRQVLEPLSRVAFEPRSPRRGALETYALAHPELVAYARFRAGEPADAVGSTRTALPATAEGRYHLYAQWAAAEQLDAAGDGLFLDLPVGVHPQGFDTQWAPDAFCDGVEGGAPPDLFFSRGQKWGFRPFHPRGLRAQQYGHLAEVLRHAMSHSTALRLDHVMGLYRLYWVPDGAEATDGAYVRYRDDELRAIVALEAARSGTAVVGEDLGTVPEEVREGMAGDRMLRSWVLQFEVTTDTPLPDPPELSMASVGTHDLPRFAEYFDAPGRTSWRRVLGGDARRGLRMCLDQLAAGPARLMLVDVEDLWLERWPHNRPGTGPDAGNWQHRASRTLEELAGDEDVIGAFERIDVLRREELS